MYFRPAGDPAGAETPNPDGAKHRASPRPVLRATPDQIRDYVLGNRSSAGSSPQSPSAKSWWLP